MRPIAALLAASFLLTAASSVALADADSQHASRLAARRAAARAMAERTLAAPRPAAAAPAPGNEIAGWQGNGMRVCDAVGSQGLAEVVPDGAGGMTTVWLDVRNGKVEVYGLRFDSNGDRAAGWPVNGVQVAARDSSVIATGVTPDGSGGLFASFIELFGFTSSTDLFLTRLTGSGGIGAGFTTAGLALGAVTPVVWGLAADGASVYVVWSDINGDTRLQRVTYAGAVAPGWPAGGMTLSAGSFASDLGIDVDGAGGVYIAYARNDSIIIHRVTSAGTPASGWPADGFAAVTSVGFGRSSVGCIRLSNNDVGAGWTELRNFTDVGVYAVRVTAAWAVASGWEGGAVVCDESGDQTDPQGVSDGAGGAMLAWRDDRDGPANLYGIRLGPNGSVAGTWPAGGLRLCSDTKDVIDYSMASDNAGGAVLAWSAGASGDLNVFGQRVLPTGSIAAGWDANGELICDAPEDQDEVRAIHDNAGGLITTWTDSREQIAIRVYAAHVNASGTVPVAASLVNATAAPGLVSLRWFVADADGARLAVERSESGGAWLEQATVRPGASGEVAWEDRAVVAGRSYGYRLVAVSPGGREAFGEVTLRVPDAARLALAGFRPNPPDGRYLLAFSLASDAAATLEVLDVSGRRVLARELRGLGAGEQVLSLPEAGGLPAGLYFARLTQGGRSATVRFVRAN